MNRDRGLPRYEPLERLRVLRPVDRITYLAAACAGKRVLDLGAMDETAFDAKRGRGTWLHEVIAAHAREVVGLDNSARVPESGLETAPNAWIHRGEAEDLQGFLRARRFEPEVVVAGELIEHVESPLAFLRGLRAINTLRGKTLLLSTPNATAFHNVVIGLASRESTHRDHLSILSYKTLCTLCLRAGFREWELHPYYARFTEMRERNAGWRRALVSLGESGVNGIEWLFPLLSFGYVVEVTI